MTFEKLKRGYLTLAIHWLNASLLFVLVCMTLGAGFLVLDWVRSTRLDSLNNTRAIRTLDASEARRVFREFHRVGLNPVSRPWIGFSEEPWHSRWVNIDPADPVPVRRTPPPATGSFRDRKVIWLFGGSTAMGYGLPDDLTLSAQLQKTLQEMFPESQVSVVDQAHVGHFSSQEVTLFQWLLRSGKRADLAVFLDGINDAGYALDKPDIDFRGTVAPATQPLVTFSARFPPVRLFQAIRKIIFHEPPPNAIPGGAELAARISTVEQRYLANVRFARAIGASVGMETLFIWQPTPFDSIDARLDEPEVRRVHRFLQFEPEIKPINARFRAGIHEPGFLFLADLFAHDRFVDTYLDAAHYGDMATEKLARAITRCIQERHLLTIIGSTCSRPPLGARRQVS